MKSIFVIFVTPVAQYVCAAFGETFDAALDDFRVQLTRTTVIQVPVRR